MRAGECEWRRGGDRPSDWSERGEGAGDADPRDDAAGCEEGCRGALSGGRELGGAGGGAVSHKLAENHSISALDDVHIMEAKMKLDSRTDKPFVRKVGVCSLGFSYCRRAWADA